MSRAGSRRKTAFMSIRALPSDRADVARVARKVASVLPEATRAVVIRAALRLGLSALEADPSLIVKPATVPAPAPASA